MTERFILVFQSIHIALTMIWIWTIGENSQSVWNMSNCIRLIFDSTWNYFVQTTFWKTKIFIWKMLTVTNFQKIRTILVRSTRVAEKQTERENKRSLPIGDDLVVWMDSIIGVIHPWKHSLLMEIVGFVFLVENYVYCSIWDSSFSYFDKRLYIYRERERDKENNDCHFNTSRTDNDERYCKTCLSEYVCTMDNSVHWTLSSGQKCVHDKEVSLSMLWNDPNSY